MRFPGFGSPGASKVSFALGETQRVQPRVSGDRLELWQAGEVRGGAARAAMATNRRRRLRRSLTPAPPLPPRLPVQLLEVHPLAAASWHTAVLPSKEHALCLQLGGSACDGGRELVLRAGAGSKARERVEELHRQLSAASAACRQPGTDEVEQWAPDPRALSFGSPVTDEADASAPQGSWQPAAGELEPGCDSEGESEGEEGEEEGDEQLWSHSPSAAAPDALDVQPRRSTQHRSAPASPVLPGLPLVATGPSPAAPARRPSASAPVSPAALRGHPAGQAAAGGPPPPERPPLPRPPVRLLSFSGRPGSESVQSHVQRLEAAVAQLSSELAQSRAAPEGGDSRAASPTKPPPAVEQPPAEAPSPPLPTATALRGATSSSSRRQAAQLSQEHALLLQQQAAMQVELARMQGQLSAAASDNIRLATEAATAVRQLAAAAETVQASQQREQQLHASLAAAVGQCEALGLELAGLSAKLEARTGQCQELRCGAAGCLPACPAVPAACCKLRGDGACWPCWRSSKGGTCVLAPGLQDCARGAIWREDRPHSGANHRPAAAQRRHAGRVCSRVG